VNLCPSLGHHARKGERHAARTRGLLFAAVPAAVHCAPLRLARAALLNPARLDDACAARHRLQLRRLDGGRHRLGRVAARNESGRRSRARILGRRRGRNSALRVGALLVSPRRAQLDLALAARPPDASQCGVARCFRRLLSASNRRSAVHHLGRDGVLSAAWPDPRSRCDRGGVPRVQRGVPAREHPHAALGRNDRAAPREPRDPSRAWRACVQLRGLAVLGHDLRHLPQPSGRRRAARRRLLRRRLQPHRRDARVPGRRRAAGNGGRSKSHAPIRAGRFGRRAA